MAIETELIDKNKKKEELEESTDNKVFSQKPDKDIEKIKTQMVNFAGDI